MTMTTLTMGPMMGPTMAIAHHYPNVLGKEPGKGWKVSNSCCSSRRKRMATLLAPPSSCLCPTVIEYSTA